MLRSRLVRWLAVPHRPHRSTPSPPHRSTPSPPHRSLHLTPSFSKAGHYKITRKKDRPLTYEQAGPPYRIGVTKAWNSWNNTTLRSPGQACRSEVAVEDAFIRRFILGTWHKTWLSEVIVKRRNNEVVIAGVISPLPSVATVHFLCGYAEELLSRLLQTNVCMELQCVDSRQDLIYKHI